MSGRDRTSGKVPRCLGARGVLGIVPKQQMTEPPQAAAVAGPGAGQCSSFNSLWARRQNSQWVLRSVGFGLAADGMQRYTKADSRVAIIYCVDTLEKD